MNRLTRRTILAAAPSALALASGLPAFAQKKYDAGVTDSEIKLGHTAFYTGPASSYGTIGKAMAAYYRMVNDQGGVNGRKITFLSYDDAYSPPKTVEQTRRLVEQDGVLGISASLGTPTNAATQRYLNDKKVPQLFLFTGTSRFRDPEHRVDRGDDPSVVDQLGRDGVELAPLDVRVVRDPDPDGQLASVRQRRCLRQVPTLRNRQHLLHGSHAILRIPTAAQDGANKIADAELGDVWAHRFYRAGNIQARYVRGSRRRRILP